MSLSCLASDVLITGCGSWQVKRQAKTMLLSTDFSLGCELAITGNAFGVTKPQAKNPYIYFLCIDAWQIEGKFVGN